MKKVLGEAVARRRPSSRPASGSGSPCIGATSSQQVGGNAFVRGGKRAASNGRRVNLPRLARRDAEVRQGGVQLGGGEVFQENWQDSTGADGCTMRDTTRARGLVSSPASGWYAVMNNPANSRINFIVEATPVADSRIRGCSTAIGDRSPPTVPLCRFLCCCGSVKRRYYRRNRKNLRNRSCLSAAAAEIMRCIRRFSAPAYPNKRLQAKESWHEATSPFCGGVRWSAEHCPVAAVGLGRFPLGRTGPETHAGSAGRRLRPAHARTGRQVQDHRQEDQRPRRLGRRKPRAA